jgi:hypothetical protein
MSYEFVLKFAGAKVIDYKEFGSYQGNWIAVIKKGKSYCFVIDYFGSCSGCDAFQSEFGGTVHFQNDVHHNIFDEKFYEDCEKCQEIKQNLIKFGKNYLLGAMNYERALKKVSENSSWDYEAQEMIDFVNKYKEIIK